MTKPPREMRAAPTTPFCSVPSRTEMSGRFRLEDADREMPVDHALAGRVRNSKIGLGRRLCAIGCLLYLDDRHAQRRFVSARKTESTALQ